MIKIYSKRIYLRKLTLDDASEEYCKWLNDSEVNKYLETRQATIGDLKKYITEKNQNKNCLFLGIFDKENNKHIGNLKLEPIDFENKIATFSILIGQKEYWNKGIGTEATKLITDYAFNVLNLESLELGVISENKAAIRAYEKAGFRIKEIKEKAMNHNGILYDKVIMGINKNKLVLGTAQFGLNYGINNKKGKISKQEAFRILEFANKNNIDFIDTASAYGDSEKIIGEFLQKENNNFKVVSKISFNTLKNIEKLFDESLKNLNLKEIYGYLIHDFKDFQENPEVIEILRKLKQQGKIKKIGFSVYYPKEIIYLLENNIDFDLIQIPFNIFDQRFLDLFPRLKEKGIEIHVRSVFLQGLFFKNPEELDKRFIKIKPKLLELKSIANKINIPLSAVCINFAVLNNYIDKIIVGVDSLEHLKENLQDLEYKEKVKEIYFELLKLKEDDEKIILPFNWVEETDKKKKILAIIQARMGSSRLPGKMLKQINGKPLIWYIINTTKKSKLIDEVVLATTDKENDKILLEKSKEYNIRGFAGSENDVLDRFYQTAKKYNGEIIVRLTGDCPLHDSKVIDKVIQNFIDNKADYASNVHPPTFPDGLDIEVLSFKVLEKMWKEAKLQSEREHVTPYIYNNKNLFKILNIEYPKDLSSIRWTVDEQKDLEFVSQIITKLNGKEISIERVLNILKQSPRLGDINKMYNRNEGYTKSVNKDLINKFKKSNELLSKAKKIIPSASQTYSKSSKYFVEGAAPAFLKRGKGGHVWDVDGNEFIDFVCALGPITIGYNDERINQAIISELNNGISFSLPTELEVKLAEKLISIIPCAEMVKFVKNGSDATTAAIRLSRAYTKKDIVVCCGYHGYHDWYIGSTDNNLGVPEEVKKLTKKFEYNNIESLKKIFEENKGKVAAVILEPLQDKGPKDNFLEKVKEICHENNAVLIFDEVVSGFRISLGGAQEYYNVIPDLSALGKGMGNGASISALAGKKEIMELIDKGAFVSTTFGGETTGFAAALATIGILEKPESFQHILSLGNKWIKEVQKLIDLKQLNEVVEIYGLSPHCGVILKGKGNLTNHDLFSVYQQVLIENGILSLGVNNFCLAHTEEDVNKFVFAVDLAFDKVKEALQKNSVEEILKGKKFRPIFKR